MNSEENETYGEKNIEKGCKRKKTWKEKQTKT